MVHPFFTKARLILRRDSDYDIYHLFRPFAFLPLYLKVFMSASHYINRLGKGLIQLDKKGAQDNQHLLEKIAQSELPLSQLKNYSQMLLFLLTHPANDKLFSLAKKEAFRMSRTCNANKTKWTSKLLNSGLPYMPTEHSFSFDMNKYLLEQKQYNVRLSGLDGEINIVSQLLQITLPKIEKVIASNELGFSDFMQELKIKETNTLPFLVQEVDKLQKNLVKDYFWEALYTYTTITSRNKSFSILFNCYKTGQNILSY